MASKAEYLKKYLSGESDYGISEKKRRRRKVKKHSNVVIHDDDVDWRTIVPKIEADEEEEDPEDAPTVAEMYEENGKRDARWKSIQERTDEFSQIVKSERLSPPLPDPGAIGGSRIRHDSPDISPPRKSRRRNDSADTSPPRRGVYKYDSPDISPPRRTGERHDSPDISPPRRPGRRHDSPDISPPRRPGKRHDSLDISPPRRTGKRHGSPDISPPRRTGKRHDSPDISPPRRTGKRHDSPDISPPRRTGKRHDSPDISPPRRAGKRHDSPDISPPRRAGKRHDSPDISPPRRASKRHDSPDISPPRKHQTRDESPDISPPRKGGRHDDSDISPPRKQRTNDPGRPQDVSRRERMSLPKQPTGVGGQTLSGAKAGLQPAHGLREEIKASKEAKDDYYRRLDTRISGRNAETVYRNKEGKRVDPKKGKVLTKEEELQKMEDDRQFAQWGRGVAQVKSAMEKAADDLYEMSKPLARYRDDEDLEILLKERERAGDPMLAFIKKKGGATGKNGRPKKGKPTYKGSYPLNRFGIRPGYRWDGIDRSNGYEKMFFSKKASSIAVQEEAYKWSVEDM